MNNTNLDLEPRLVEYLKRKKFFEENDINSVSLEKQYMITKTDLIKINKFNNGVAESESDYDNENDSQDEENHSDRKYIQRRVKNYDEDNDLIDCSNSRFAFNNIVDPRMERINEKVRREKDAGKQKLNTTNLKQSYDMYSRNFSSATSRDFENEFTLDNIRDEMNSNLTNNFESNSNFNTHELVNPPSNHQYHSQPKIQFNQNQHFQRVGQNSQKLNNNFNSSNDLGSGYTYRKPELPQFQKPNSFDIDNKVNIPSNNCRKTDLNALYNNVGGGEMKNIDYENYVKYGYPTSKARSLGFENASDHFFHFIDSDIQDPSHVIFDRPRSTRVDNKTIAKSKKRDTY